MRKLLLLLMAAGTVALSCKKDDDNKDGGCTGTTAKVTVHNDRAVDYTLSIVEYEPGTEDDGTADDRTVAEDVKLKPGEKREFTLNAAKNHVFSVSSDLPDVESGANLPKIRFMNDITLELKACSEITYPVQTNADIKQR